jgi:hypothetical protein
MGWYTETEYSYAGRRHRSIDNVQLVSLPSTSFIVISPRLIKSLLSTKQATEPSFRLSGLLLDGLVELVDGSIELLARLLELLVGAVLEGIHLGLGSLRFGFCVIGLAVLASVPVACNTPSPALGASSM